MCTLTVRNPRQAILPFVLVVTALCIVAPVAPAEGPVTIKLWDYHIHDKKFRQNIFKTFNKDNPDIKVEYTSQVGSSYQTVLDASFRSGTPPDLFVPSGAVTLTRAIEMGWVIPLDDVAPSGELAKWMARFPKDQQPFLEGRDVIKGKVYSWPIGGQGGYNMLFYNTKLFADAGLKGPDGAAAVPQSLDDVRQFAKKITQLGQGKIFGISHGVKNPDQWWHDALYPSLNDGGTEFDYRTGRYDYTNPALHLHIQNWLDLKNDGSVFPGDLSMDDEQAKFKFAQDLAGMLYGGPWVPGGLIALNDSLQFDVTLSPTEKAGVRKGSVSVGALANVEYMVSSKTKSRQAVWRVIQFITSQQYQEGWVRAGGGYSVFPEYNKPEFFPHPTIAKIATMGLTRVNWPEAPEGANKVWELIEYSHPNLMETIQGIYVGALKWDALADVSKRYNDALDKALVEAKSFGVNMTRADLTFPDWDPTKSYIRK